MTITYKLSISNLEFTLGVTENTDVKGNRLNEWYVPMSLRVKDRAVENSAEGEIVDFIFAKNEGDTIYDELVYKDDNKKIPKNVQERITPSLYLDYKNANMIDRES